MGIFELLKGFIKKALPIGQEKSNDRQMTATWQPNGNPDKNSIDKINIDKFSIKDDTSEEVDLEHLTSDGELPFGWTYRNRDFVNKISSENTYFLNMWLESRKKSPKELYSALKSFVLFLEDVEKVCKEKGECFEFWFYNILSSPDYLQKRKDELETLTINFEKLQEIYEKKPNLPGAVINLLKANDGILQSEFKKLFDEPFQNDVSDILYNLQKEGKLEKIKSGRSYILHFRG
jgi:hypothetical protein